MDAGKQPGQEALADHYNGKAKEKEEVRSAFELFKLGLPERLFFKKVTADRIDQRIAILSVILIPAADPIIDNGMTLDGDNGIHDIKLERVAELPFVNGCWVMGVEVLAQLLLVNGDEDADLCGYWITHSTHKANT